MCTAVNYLICIMKEPIIAIYLFVFYCGFNFLQNVTIKIGYILFSNSCIIPSNTIRLIKLKHFLNQGLFEEVMRGKIVKVKQEKYIEL